MAIEVSSIGNKNSDAMMGIGRNKEKNDDFTVIIFRERT
jgi:hypothetical protein